MKTHLTPKQMKASSAAARLELLKTPPKKMWKAGDGDKSKIPSLRTLRRQFLAAQKPTATSLLTEEEYARLEALISEAGDSNIDVYNAAREVGKLRLQLDSAEGELSRARQQNCKIHTEMAPLFQRLPA